MMDDMHDAVMLTVWAGEVDYRVALGWQEQLVEARREGLIDDVLLMLSHPPVYTAGRHADVDANVTGLRPGIPVVRIDRGGDVTYHGPGQVVAYPIVRLDEALGARRYVTALEDALIDTVGAHGVAADRRRCYPGVWVNADKIAAVGVRITNRVTKHGVALNVRPDLADFGGIVPCGITDGGVTSLSALGAEASPEDVARDLTAALAHHLRRTPRAVRPAELGLHATVDAAPTLDAP